MNKTNTFKLILCLAAILFIAKPFMGYTVFERLHDKEETNLLVKIFAKRKPEFLDEAAAKSATVKQLLRQNAKAFNLTLSTLLVTLFSYFATRFKALSALSKLHHNVVASCATPIYLLNRSLTI
ncbi:hypothetical protein [uncultured Mucilaginibacter sp.]|uniref:hypothetical protein n=1 Tax=uncultured Mucilaginibacter sp. TaxID=797541 RepID=UPI0025F935B8|nr:hypothetical protein [uncultured Mucilaginibacter sp.]